MEIKKHYEEVNGYDVVVCGGGPAGVAAAIAAGRKGAKTLLLERGGCLGGFWTRGLLTWLINALEQEGLLQEVMDRLEQEAEGKRVQSPKRFIADTEKTKLVFERMCREAGVEILYHTVLSGAVKCQGRITHVLTESKSGSVAYGGKIFIDTTGDGDLGAYAGAEFDMGNGEGMTQPLSLICQLSGLDYEDMAPFDSQRSKNTKPAMLQELAKLGITPSYGGPLLAVLNREVYALMINHIHYPGTSAKGVTQATMEAREELHTIVDALRRSGGIWKNIRIATTADAIGVREGRRLHGLYTVTAEDVYAGRSFPDGICCVSGNTDIHSVKPGGAGYEQFVKGNKHPPYEIPLGCLVSRDVENLLMGGRCISGDFVAHGSYRVAGPVFRTGEVSGLLAAHCAKNNVSPQTLPKI
ncbi:MAG: FAD-dependent oxidoreductase [Oscillospiraceae bacterium]|nr:FAD-dependent oxidoreductase [Oscillospiraceae bacterium]